MIKEFIQLVKILVEGVQKRNACASPRLSSSKAIYIEKFDS